MRVLIPLFAILVPIAYGATAATPMRTQFLNRTKRYVAIWDTTQLGTFCDPIWADIVALKTMAEIGDNIMTYALGVYKSNMMAALPLLTVKNNMDNCVKPYGSTAMDVLSRVLEGVGLGLTKAYKLLKNKAKTMIANSKTNAQITEQLYSLGSAACTPDLVQHILWFSMKNVSAGEWSCCVQYMPNFFIVTPPEFDLTYRPNKWMYAYKK